LLTNDLVRIRRKGELVLPRFLSEGERERLLPTARRFVESYSSMIGRSRAELDDALDAVAIGARDRAIGLGLRKLCDDRVELAAPGTLDPEATRAAVFAASARAHREKEGGFDRAGVLRAVASELGASVEAIEEALFSDLEEAQRVVAFQSTTAEELLGSYDLALVQALLLRATRVRVTAAGVETGRLRALLRAARFHGLLYVVEQRGLSWQLTLDGPFSMFDAVQRYGLRLAVFLPHVVALGSYSFEADLLVGKERRPMRLELDGSCPLVASRIAPIGPRPEVEQLASSFRELESKWTVSPTDRLLTLADGSVAVPDLAFCHRETGEEVAFELMGFWSREAVWRRVELLASPDAPRMLLGVRKALRVSEAVLDEEATGSALVVFTNTPSARAVLAKLEGSKLAADGPRPMADSPRPANGSARTPGSRARRERS
jgi:predicted nuclease of restriction endonuclease-like RecB superfamily